MLYAFTSPEVFCSTPVGRYILGWYISLEDICCLSAAYTYTLPQSWRIANVHARLEPAQREYPRLSRNIRIPRLLDDLWPQLWVIDTRLMEIQQLMLQLKALNQPALKLEIAIQLEEQLAGFAKEITAFSRSKHVVEVFTSSGRAISTFSNHAHCCPPFPYIDFVTDCPQAGFLRYVIYGILAYVHELLQPFVNSILNRPSSPYNQRPVPYVIELCRTFAGLEASFVSSPDFLFPCFPGLVSAAMTVPPELRVWVWCKLRHLESTGRFKFDGVKKTIAELWQMPEILEADWSWTDQEKDDAAATLLEHEKEEHEGMMNAKIDEGDEEDSELEDLTNVRGMFGLTGRDTTFRRQVESHEQGTEIRFHERGSQTGSLA